MDMAACLPSTLPAATKYDASKSGWLWSRDFKFFYNFMLNCTADFDRHPLECSLYNNVRYNSNHIMFAPSYNAVMHAALRNGLHRWT